MKDKYNCDLIQIDNVELVPLYQIIDKLERSIEREKIDKAIEEIEQLINHSKLPTVNIYNRYSEGLKDCLEILKRNIGEEVESKCTGTEKKR